MNGYSWDNDEFDVDGLMSKIVDGQPINTSTHKPKYTNFCRRLSMKKLHLPIIVEQDEDGYYIVSCPAFKGCHSYGKTIDKAIKNIREVVGMCLEEEGVENLNEFVGFRELEIAYG